MKKIFNPKLLLFITVLPLVIVFFLLKGNFDIIKSLLSEKGLEAWYITGIFIITLVLLHLIYIMISIYKKRQVSVYYLALTLIVNITFLYYYMNILSVLAPWNIPHWLIDQSIRIYPWTFIMPSMFYSLLGGVILLTNKNTTLKYKFIYPILIPIIWYVIIQMPLSGIINDNLGGHLFVIFTIVCIITFLFFLIWSIYLLVIRKRKTIIEYNLILNIVFGIVFPMLGLFINNFTFGNFSNIIFYILALVNGIIICLPYKKNKYFSLFLFIGKSITFSYVTYFFIVFLPFLPLSIFFIIIVGFGFIMLTPLILGIIQTVNLYQHFSFLEKYYAKSKLYLCFILAFISLPLLIVISFIQDKVTLNKALEYVYSPDDSKEYKINSKSLLKIINVTKEHKEETFFNKGNLPYISPFYNWLVLGNLTLSDTKIEQLEQIFRGKTSDPLISPRRGWRGNNINNPNLVAVSEIKHTSRFDPVQRVWISSVDMKLINNSERDNQEYKTIFELPEGCWISDYYLYIGNTKEKGILAEKKAAMWVYQQNLNINRDPGLLHYLTGNKVQFRVFPFLAKETRSTGIEFIHKDPVNLKIDNQIITLGEFFIDNEIEESADSNVIYIPARKKEKLQKIKRKPYYHFILDISENSLQDKNMYVNIIEDLLNKNYIPRQEAQVTFVNSMVSETYSIDNDWKDQLQKQKSKDGFFLDRAIKNILINSYKNNKDTYPVIVAVTDTIKNAFIENDFTNLQFTYPECEEFYVLNSQRMLTSHSLINNPKNVMKYNTIPEQGKDVFIFPYMKKVYYLPIDNSASIIIKKDKIIPQEKDFKEKTWHSALTMQGIWRARNIHPEQYLYKDIVKYSFASQIMNPLTSFIVVENEAQKAMLKRKQNQVLKSNQNLDLGENEDVQQMSEPGLLFIGGIFLIILIIKQRKRVFNL